MGAYGSPPLTRGTRQEVSDLSRVKRITPAYAGNTCISFSSADTKEDHPRLRGEHVSKISTNAKTRGSPPLTRGTHPVSHTPAPWYGITPAYAGNTGIILAPLTLFQDHPRLRGEHFPVISIDGLS